MDKALTVIIPAYNVSQYINEGIQSLLLDHGIISYLDIIVVNDGSKDDTLEKANRFKDLYPDSVIVIDKENGGHGSGINVGIENARGKYLKVLDGDDWVKTDGLVELVEYIINCKDEPDIIVNPYEKVWEDGRREVVKFDQIASNSIVGFREIVRYGYTISLHSLTIKTQIYRDYNIPMIDEKISYDDMEYTLYPVLRIKRIAILKNVIYEYRLGLSNQSMNPSQMKKKLPMHTQVINSLANYFRMHQTEFDSYQKQYFQREFTDTLGTNCDISLRSGSSSHSVVEKVRQYRDFPINKSNSSKLKIIDRFGIIGCAVIKILNHFI